MPHLPPHTLRALVHRFGLALAAAALVAACTSTPPPTPGITLGVDDATPTAVRGTSVEVTVDLTRLGGADASVALSVTGLPANVSAAFAPASLSGSATESTLTLTVAGAAAEGTADLTVTGTAGALTDDVDLTLTIGSLTISGRVQQALDRPLIGATVASQGETTFTDGTGAFTLSGLSLPYDLVVSSAAGTGGLHVFEGLTSPTPVLRPTFAVLDPVTPTFNATVDGSLVAGALGANEAVVVCVEGVAVAVYGCDSLIAGDAAYSIAAAWFDGSTASVRLHALHFEVDADAVPTTYLGYETFPFDLSDGVPVISDLDFDPVASDDLTGTTDHPVALPDTDLVVLARFGPNLSMPISGISDPGATAFEVLVPVLPGLTYDVLFSGSSASGGVITWRHDVGLDAGALAVAVPALPVAPADATTGVGLATPFSSTADGAARTYAWGPNVAGPFIGLTTTRTSVTIPDPALAGFAMPAGADYNWTLLGHGDDGVDTAAAGGYADYFTILYGLLGAGGPGLDSDRTFALPTDSRDFTFAP